MATPTKKRIVLSLAEKIAILDRLKAGETRQSLVNETGLSMRSIERFVSSEKKLRLEAESGATPTRKRKRTGKNGEIEEALGAWFTSVRNQKQVE